MMNSRLIAIFLSGAVMLIYMVFPRFMTLLPKDLGDNWDIVSLLFLTAFVAQISSYKFSYSQRAHFKALIAVTFRDFRTPMH